MSRYWVHSAPEDLDLDDDQRECARADRCADARVEVVDGRSVRFGAPTPRGLCDTCASLVERALKELPGLWWRVHGELGTKGQAVGPRVATSKSAPLPLNLAADELLRDIVHVLTSWHERVAAVARLNGHVGRRVEHATVEAACRVLAAHVGALLALPADPMMRALPLPAAAELVPYGAHGLVHLSAEYADVIRPLSGTDAGLEVLQLHYRARRLLGETRPPARHLPTPCRCGWKQLFEVLDFDGQHDGAHCRHCRTTYTPQEYRDLVDEVGETVRRSGVRRRMVLAGPGDDAGSRRGLGYEPFHHRQEETDAPQDAIIV
jgi:hypothetical protein